jgi:hypothetical protein
VNELFMHMQQASRYHGYRDTTAPAFLNYQVARLVDLADRPIPSGWTLPNGTRYPRKPASSTDTFHFNYSALFNQTFADYYGFTDPRNASRHLNLCELVNAGTVNEVWLNVEGGDANVAEAIEYKQIYDTNDNPISGRFEACAGNGCVDGSDQPAFAACHRSLRVVGIGEERGPGCITQEIGHAIEGMPAALPAFRQNFLHFANMDLNTRFGVSFDAWYYCDYYPPTPCLAYTGNNSVTYHIGGRVGTFSPLNQGCGNAHFAPNSRDHYDYMNTTPVLSTCEHYGLHDGTGGADMATLYSPAQANAYEMSLCGGYCDCGGGWTIYWMQNFPGLNNPAHTSSGAPMKNWWPYMFY